MAEFSNIKFFSNQKFVENYKKYKSAISDTKPLRKRLYISLILLLFFCISDKSISNFDFFIVSVEGLSTDSTAIFLCAFVLCFAVIHLWKFFVACRDYRVEKFRKAVLKACFNHRYLALVWIHLQWDVQTLFDREPEEFDRKPEDIKALLDRKQGLKAPEKRNEYLEIIGDNMYGMLEGKIGSRLVVFFEMILIPWFIPWVSLVIAITVLFYKVSL